MRIPCRFAVRAVAFVLALGLAPAAFPQDPGVYRGFSLGATIAEVAAQAGVPATEVQVVFERPRLIQELEWRPAAERAQASAPAPDSVERMLFGFCDGKLYRIVVNYDPDRTEGLTTQDVIDALSEGYGAARTPRNATIITSPARESYSETEAVVARWEDARSSINLFQRSYRSTFGLVIFSKALAPAARAAIEQALRLSRLDAPRRYLAEQTTREAAERALHAKARTRNKAAFRF